MLITYVEEIAKSMPDTYGGEKQLAKYLDYYRLTTGYMISFYFNKGKQPGLHEVAVGDRIICEAIV